MNRFSLPVALAAVAMVAACTGVPDQRVTVPRAPVEAKQRIAFGSVLLREVSLPNYAAGEEIFVGDAAGLLNTQPGLLWADDPSRAITLELSRHLSQITGVRAASEPWPFEEFAEAQVEVRIEEMLARDAGVFRLAGQYFVTSESGRARARLFDLSVPVDIEGGAPALAAARAQAVGDLALEIARGGLR
ncbi:ABC-type transport auxiliary lipoprotein family protein [uncultured Roseovarius sp.]|uniref:PqiC family protein n=1 Tax=uncultured Roseovarius sp. TaxID=293344 RepID=UPI00262007B7|nr:ABC-type transport auxiliary lipoprotein family protein [uncultured Roseovarius sp.]